MLRPPHVKTAVPTLRLMVFVCALLGGIRPALADPNVAVIAKAQEDYTEQKFADGKPARETYVFMQGNYFEGATVDHSLERMPFRRIAEYLGVELARQNYLPARSVKEAKLLLVVHWGTTTPRVSRQEMFGQSGLTQGQPGTRDIADNAQAHPLGDLGALPDAPGTAGFPDSSPLEASHTDRSMDGMAQSMMSPDANDAGALADRVVGNVTEGNAVQLLGYQEEIHKLSKNGFSQTQSDIINFHLTNERYFITIMAYDLKKLREASTRQRPVWSLNLNISSPGNNFSTALDHISIAAAEYAGRSTDGLQTVRPTIHQGKVNLAPLVIIGEVKEPSKRDAR